SRSMTTRSFIALLLAPALARTLRLDRRCGDQSYGDADVVHDSSRVVTASLPATARFAIVPRRHAELAFEGAIEGGLRFVADVECDLCDRLCALLEEARSELQPPAREVRERRFTQEACEPLGQNRARCADLRCKLFDSP